MSPDPEKQQTGRILSLDPACPAPEAILAAADAIRSGKVVVFPTWCLYGLAADALNPAAIDRVFAIKERPATKPILALVPDLTVAKSLVERIPDTARLLMDAFWPGQITLVMKAARGVPPQMTAGTGKIGVRVPVHPVATALVQALNRPITGTSANQSGMPGAADIRAVGASLLSRSDLVLDAGPLKGGTGSTVVDLTENPPRLLREGAISTENLMQTLGGRLQTD